MRIISLTQSSKFITAIEMNHTSKITCRVIAFTVAFVMLAPFGLTFTSSDVIYADFPPTVTVKTPASEDQIYNGTIVIYWFAWDFEDDDNTLDIEIECSPDAGITWFTIMSGTDNNNPPYAWDTINAGVPDGVNYLFNITTTDNANQSDSDMSYMFSIDNILDDRWYLQIESMNIGSNLDLDMKPSESAIQEIFVNIPTSGNIPVQTFSSEYRARCEMDLVGEWTFSINAKVSLSAANGSLYANIYADDGTAPRLLITTGYDDEWIGSHFVYHEFSWLYLVPSGTMIYAGEHVDVQIMLNATASSSPSTYNHYANADIPVIGNVSGNYTMTHVSDDQFEIIEEFDGSTDLDIAFLDEDFDENWPPGGWNVVNGGSGPGNPTWTNKNPRNRTPSPPIADPFAIVDIPRNYGNPPDIVWDEQLVSPVLDLSYAYTVTLEYDQWLFSHWQDEDMTALVDVRSNLTNGTWVNLLNLTGMSTANPNHRSFNISTLAAGSPDVQIRFYLLGPNAGLHSYWVIDNVVVLAHINATMILEHKWTISVPANEEPYEFSLEAKRPNKPDGDDFIFSFSADDVTYTEMVTVNRQIEKIYTYSLPSNLSGTIYIRVRDVNRLPGGDLSSVEIDQMYISSVGPPKLTIGFDHYTTPSYVEPVLTFGPIAYLCIQDAPGGIGNNVTTHTMTTDDTFTVWSIGYDSGWNYVSDIPANWTNTLNAQTATASTSFTLNPTAPGSGTITADFNTTLSNTTGLITVTVGFFANIIIRDSPDGLGNEASTYSMTTDEMLTLWAAGYDAESNYIGDIDCNWSTNGTLDFQTAIMTNNFTFEPLTAGTSGYIIAVNSTIASSTGLITVGVGVLNHIIIRYASGGGSSEVGDVLMVLGQNLTIYSAGYDADNNYIGEIPSNWTTTGTLNLTTATIQSSFTFVPATAGETGTINATFNGTISDETGTITVTGFGIDYIIIEDGMGNEVTTHTMTTEDTLTVWAIGYNFTEGEIGPVNANWTTTGTLDLQTASYSQSFTFDPIHAPTSGNIDAIYETLWDATGVITVNPGPLTYLCIQDSSGGTGTNVTTHTMTREETFTIWSIGYDAEWNYIGDVNCNWSTNGTLDFQSAFGVNNFTFAPSTADTSGFIIAVYGTLFDSAGLITVGVGSLDHTIIRFSPSGAGSEVGDVWIGLGQTLTVYSAGYDSAGNYIGDIPCNWTTTGTLNLTTATIQSSFTFVPATTGEIGTINATFNGTISDETGTITVAEFGIDLIVIVDDLCTPINLHIMDTTETLRVWAMAWNISAGPINPVAADWITTGTLDLQTATASTSFTFDPVHAPTSGSIRASYMTYWDSVPTVIVNLGPLANLCIHDAAGGSGTNVTTHTMTTGETFTVWAIGYDAEWNYIGNINCDWATTGTLDFQTATGFKTFTFSPVNPGTGTIIADYNTTISDATGLITVTEPIATFDIDLQIGWNLISIPLTMQDTSVENVLSNISGFWDVAKYYDRADAADPWKSWRNGGTENDLAQIDRTMGLWLHATSVGTLSISGNVPSTTMIDLKAGWNLVGYPSSQVKAASVALAGTGADIVSVFQSTTPYLQDHGDLSTVTMEAGKGYWIHVPADTTWIINW